MPHEQPLPTPLTPEVVFAGDLAGLKEADVLLAILDGVQVDDGTACEIGIFWSLMQANPTTKRIIGLINDSRKQPGTYVEGIQINLFVAGAVLSSGPYCYSIDEVLGRLAEFERNDA